MTAVVKVDIPRDDLKFLADELSHLCPDDEERQNRVWAWADRFQVLWEESA